MTNLHPPDIYLHRTIIHAILAFILFSIGPVGVIPTVINGFLFGFCCGSAVSNLISFIRSLLD